MQTLQIHIGPSRQGRRVVFVVAALVPALLASTRIEARLFIGLAWSLALFWWWRNTPGLGGPEVQLWQVKEGWRLHRGSGEPVPITGLRRGWVSAWLASGELMTPVGPVRLVVPADSTDPEDHRALRRLLLAGLPVESGETQSTELRGT
ncbi:hypothetical protein [endosymbiont of unidentified scaly snail isolate Monju]|uniref:hypothetical protein n=1 Tax=endosymbiont of unidentified scaly snail isolate Monju TaxID=1248727 RepID=UPI0005B79753|nr:hypothetical protein [endosymbiont of unidentified scaly snail isolate Monju]